MSDNSSFLGRFARSLWYVVIYDMLRLALELLPNHSVFNRVRGACLGIFFASVDGGLMIARGCTLVMVRNLHVGRDVYIAHGVWINATGGVSLGDGVVLSPGVVVASTRHNFVNGRVSLEASSNAPIVIGAGSWVASNAVVTMDVSIGEGVVIGACSVVTGDLESGGFYAGLPARSIC